LLEPIETHLIGQEKIVDDEKARIKAAEEAKQAERLQARITQLSLFGAVFNGQTYTAYGLQIPTAIMTFCTDEEFAAFIGQVQAVKDADDARLKAEEDAKKAEAERMAKVAAEQEAERLRLLTLAKEQEEAERKRLYDLAEEERKARIKERLETEYREKKEAELRAEAEKVRKEKEEWEAIKAQEARDIAAAKQKVIDDALHAAEIEKAKKEAAEQARLQAIEDARIADEAQVALREAQKIAAEEKAARAPDKEKLLLFAILLENISYPDMKTKEGTEVLDMIVAEIVKVTATLREKVEVL